DKLVTGVQTCALPIYRRFGHHPATQGFVRGLALAVAGVFVVVLTRIMNTSGWNPTNLMITLGAIVIGATRRVPVFVVLAVAAIEIGRASCRERGWVWV